MTFPLKAFHLTAFRNYDQASLEFRTGVTLVSGPNGAGKTSLLESIHVLASGRSFRTGRHDKLVQNGEEQTVLRAELVVDGHRHRIGMARGRQGLLQVKLDGERVRGQSRIAQMFPVVALHPDTVDLVEGGAEGRRRLFDWLMFHVEHSFLDAWRDMRHAVRQRNGLLKKGSLNPRELKVWDQQLTESSGRIDELRRARFGAFREAFKRVLKELSEELPDVSVKLFSGWESGADLAAILAERREQDQARGFTSAGAHRMDLKLTSSGGAVKEVFSRGQKKLVAYAMVLAALEVMAGAGAQARECVVLVDDLSSELDEEHGRRVLTKLAALPHQVVITSLDASLPAGLASDSEIAMFHVEHGRLEPVVAGH